MARSIKGLSRIAVGLLAVGLTVAFVNPAPTAATPAYTQQSGLACASCHYGSGAPDRGNVNQFGQGYANCNYVLNCAVALARAAQNPNPTNFAQPAPAQQATSTPFNPMNPSPIWLVQLRDGARFGDGIWTRRGNDLSYDALWTIEGVTTADVMNFEGVNRNGEVSFFSSKLQLRFTGVVTPDGSHVFNGTFTGATGNNQGWMATLWEL